MTPEVIYIHLHTGPVPEPDVSGINWTRGNAAASSLWLPATEDADPPPIAGPWAGPVWGGFSEAGADSFMEALLDQITDPASWPTGSAHHEMTWVDEEPEFHERAENADWTTHPAHMVTYNPDHWPDAEDDNYDGDHVGYDNEGTGKGDPLAEVRGLSYDQVLRDIAEALGE